MRVTMNKLTNSCRACLTTSESFSYFLYENVQPEMYWFCTSLEVKQDELPKSLCNCCYSLLKKFAEFKKLCIQSENILLGLTQGLKPETELESYSDFSLELKNNAIKGKIEDETMVKTENGVYIDVDFCDDISTCDKINTTVCREKIPRKRNQSDGKRGLFKRRQPRKPFKFTCDLCHKKFSFEERFEAHKLEHEGKKTAIKCTPCNKTFTTWGGLKRHNECEHSSHSVEQLTCKLCFKVFKSLRTLKIHGASHEDKKPRICDVCGKRCKTNLTLKAHLETHIENRERHYSCEHCGKKFLTKKTCNSHALRRHSNRRFICNYCNFPFTDKNNLAKHILIHEGKQQLHKCDICFKVFSYQSSLVVHKRIHTGEKPYVCSYCPKSFSHRGMLVGHQRIHTGEKPHKCTVCDQSFTQRGTMKRHMKVHDRLCT